jgi:hypothetical protein
LGDFVSFLAWHIHKSFEVRNKADRLTADRRDMMAGQADYSFVVKLK